MDGTRVLPLDGSTDLTIVGGKGASLARLAAAGLPVPPGFHVTTGAYREFVAADGLDREIRDALELAEPAPVIAEAFARRALPAATAAAIRTAHGSLSGPVAVRSSATAEDLPDLSFAGQHDTFLNVAADDLLDAVKRCWASLWTARAIDYRTRHGVDPADVVLAVVVQELVPADSAGVLFTANPVTGARDELVIDAAWGLGEAVVGGRVTPDTHVLARGTHEVRARTVNDKAVRTVPTPTGTAEEPVPEDLCRAPVLDDAAAAELAALGERIHELYGTPMDVEWARHDGRFSILQARPVTTVAAEVWNDSLTGDYLWTCANLGEAVPSVMTPATWSAVRTLAMPAIGGHPTSGNIGGRFYLNLSVPLAVGGAVGLSSLVRKGFEPTIGRIPDGVEVPPLPMSRFAVLRAGFAAAVSFAREARVYRKNLAGLLAEGPARCLALHERIAATGDAGVLRALWRTDVDALLRETCRTLDAGARQGGPATLRQRLGALVGEGDATALLTGLHDESGELASLGPVLGLARLRRGDLDRDTYVRTWGHRCADEFELSAPRPAEDPAWIDRQLADVGEHDPEALLRRQATARAEAWRRLVARHPRKAARLERKLATAADAARARERARSEMVRAFWVLRAFVLRAGELTGHGADLFLLTFDEILAVLDGDDAPLTAVPARRTAYASYRALPAYPTVIRGRFDPHAWAADPARRTDLYDETRDHPPLGDEIAGFPGSAGIVEGSARVLAAVEDGEELRPGEILVTTVTNIGWTPLFPRAAAVVTDVGAPLSHAAIVARELGIPAVVGCGNATTRIATGDRIRVDGARGTVVVLDAQASSA